MPSDSIHHGKLPLLHVDDSASDRLLVQQAVFLTNTSFKCYEADALETAIPYFQYHREEEQAAKYPRPALVLLDYDLGGHTGVDFLYWLRILKKMTAIPIVMFSGSFERPHVAECYAAGADHFLSKPVGLARLKVIVRLLYAQMACGNHEGPLTSLREYCPNPKSSLGSW